MESKKNTRKREKEKMMERNFTPRLSAPVTRASIQTVSDNSAAAEQSMYNTADGNYQQVLVGGGVFPFADDAE
ncbi:hypothetical protein [Streptomyces sp. NBRC 110611]|uniref:hypothetical protein n=1 Tax=Streptomyces sp. NBRC 110611 TaxID=1621259 RepID=UPI0011BEEFDC|nr:hypothetical protein [Streptomyces sp. NBRC 110611]